MQTKVLVALFTALLLAGCASSGGYSRSSSPTYDGYARCLSCGTVERIERVYRERRAGGGGAVIGGIIGGILGSQVGSGSGRDAATVAGVIAGGVAGNEAEKKANAAPVYELFVRMDDGRRIVVSQRELNGVREGSYVRIAAGRARLD